ncbi:MAG: HD domain-containing phosphohydrolase [Candidatus Velthaea sp.]
MLLEPQTPTHACPVDRIGRPRLECRLTGPVAAPIVVLVGPPGSGKSDLLRPFRADPQAIFFRAGNERATFGRFVHGLAQASATLAPGAQASFPRAWERALQSPAPAIVLAHWFCEHLQGLDQRIVIDDLHAAGDDPSIAAFIGKLAELRPNAALTIAARSVGALPIALWMATRRMERPIDESELCFDRSEAFAIAAHHGLKLYDHEVDALLTATGGSAIALAYALTRLRRDPFAFSRRSAPRNFEAIADCVFARRTERERAFLRSAALFPTIEDELLGLSGWDDAPALRSAMSSDAPFMWETRSAGGIAFHDRFRTYLDRHFLDCTREFRSRIAHQTVDSLAAAGRHAEALEVATKQGLIEAARDLLDERGFEILESGEIDVIGEALGACDGPEEALGPSASALRGYLEARRGHLDTAEAWFRLGLSKAHDESVRLGIAMYYARELAVRRREDAWEIMAPFVDSPTLARSELIDVQSSFAQALTAANRLDEACARTNEALALLEAGSPPALRARVFARAAYVALESGDAELARERAFIAAPLAISQSLYDVAASTYSVLYQIAYDIDDDAVASRDHLCRLRDLGIKSGTLRLESYVLLCLYELDAEAGDEEALNALDRQIAVIDKHDTALAVMETLVPGKALQAGWRGDFAAAGRLLRATVEHQATPARKALCWAQIGLYSAAGGDPEQSDAAVHKAEAELSHAASASVQFGLALLTLALTAWVNGDVHRASEWASRADRTTSSRAPRLHALHCAVNALIDASTDTQRFDRAIPSVLDGLRRHWFGGMAKLIEALPYRFAPGRSNETIGSVLARRELMNRFAAVVAGGDEAGSLGRWLDAAPDSIFCGAPLPEQFERWAGAHPGLARERRAQVGHVRRELGAYRRRPRSPARVDDDIDAALADLVDGLDVAAPLMAEHSRAVSAWCARVARALGLDEEHILFAARCGLIHDIGKIRTPPEILNAPRALTEQEWLIMRDHAAEGARIVAGISLLEPLIPIVRGHHERLDGRGYPDGLRSSAIPLTTRIVTVADCFNAMIGRRPYRLPLSPPDALSELERHRGTQFDPEVVEAMVRVVAGRLADPGAIKIPEPKPYISLTKCR